MRKLAAYTVVRLASALSWKPPANRVKELFPATADATSRNADPNAVFVVTGASGGIGSTIVEPMPPLAPVTTKTAFGSALRDVASAVAGKSSLTRFAGGFQDRAEASRTTV